MPQRLRERKRARDMARSIMKVRDGWAEASKRRGGRQPDRDLKNGRGVTALSGTTKARVERAALALFCERGVDGVSVKEIAAAANISDGGMYRYFPAKHNLAQSLMLEIHTRLTDMVRAIESEDASFKVKLNLLVTRYCALADDDWQLFTYHLLHLHHFPEMFAPKKGRGKPLDSPVTACADMLETAMGEGDIPAGNKELLAGMALGIVVQAGASKVYGRLKGPLSIYAPEFERAVNAIVRQK